MFNPPGGADVSSKVSWQISSMCAVHVGECMTILSVIQNWVEAYSARRYGKSVADARTAWKILHRSIYNCSDGIAVTFPYLFPLSVFLSP
jgi:hypothetical protein